MKKSSLGVKERTNTNIVKTRDGMTFIIKSDTISISASQADLIVEIICEELKKKSHGQIIAMRIGQEVNP